MSKGKAFVKADGVEAVAPVSGVMNLRKWLAKGNARVIKRVEVCLAAGLEAEIRDLDAAIVAAKGAKIGLVDERLATVGPDLRGMAERAEALRAEMQESMTVFKFVGLKADRFEAIRAESSKGEDGEPNGEEVGYRILAAQCIEPAGMTWEDMKALADAIGDEAFINKIHRTAQAASAGVVDIPFSSAASAILATRES